jgi:hypothetical protein
MSIKEILIQGSITPLIPKARFYHPLRGTFFDPLSCEYKIRWFQESDLDTYIRGLNETLYERYDEARFKWKMVDTPFSLGFVSIAVAEFEGKPVGFNSFLPLRVRAGADSFPVVQGCDGFVESEHRRMGLFQKTLIFMVQELAGTGPEMLMGFNFAGSTGAAQKMGSMITGDVHALAATASNLRRIKVEGEEDVEVELCSLEEAHQLYEDWASSTGLLHYDKPEKYFRWRYSHPIRRSSFYRVRDGENVGFVATSLEHADANTYNVLLEDYTPLFHRPRVASATIKRLLDSDERLYEVYMTATKISPINEAAHLLGFQPDHFYTLIMRNISSLKERDNKLYRGSVELTRVEDWHIASSDVF